MAEYIDVGCGRAQHKRGLSLVLLDPTNRPALEALGRCQMIAIDSIVSNNAS